MVKIIAVHATHYIYVSFSSSNIKKYIKGVI